MDGDISLRSLLMLSKKQKQNRKLKILGPIISSTSTAVFSSSSSSSPFKLPDCWVIERRRRVTGRFDKYYYEPGTGRKFRSLLSVQKYLSGENVARNRSKSNHEKNMQIVPRTFKSGSHFNLPNGWVVEEKRRGNSNYAGVTDRCYIEPGTGKRFRSLISVERYLTEGKEYAAPKALSQGNQLYLTDGKEYTALSLGDHTPLKCSRKEIYDLQQPLKCLRKHVSRNQFETSILDLCNPPAKAKWVLSPRGNIWSPFIDDIQVPESVKHKWSDTLVWILNDRF